MPRRDRSRPRPFSRCWNARSTRTTTPGTRVVRGRPGDGSWFSVVLFGVMSAGFGYASYTDIYGAGDAFLIVSFVLGALCLASLVSALRSGGRGPRI